MSELLPAPEDFEEVKKIEFDRIIDESKKEIEQAIQGDLRAAYLEEMRKNRGNTLGQQFIKQKYAEQGLDKQLDWNNSQVRSMLEQRVIEKSSNLEKRAYETSQRNAYEKQQAELQRGFNEDMQQLRGLEPSTRSRRYAELCSIYRQKGLKV